MRSPKELQLPEEREKNIESRPVPISRRRRGWLFYGVIVVIVVGFYWGITNMMGSVAPSSDDPPPARESERVVKERQNGFFNLGPRRRSENGEQQHPELLFIAGDHAEFAWDDEVFHIDQVPHPLGDDWMVAELHDGAAVVYDPSGRRHRIGIRRSAATSVGSDDGVASRYSTARRRGD